MASTSAGSDGATYRAHFYDGAAAHAHDARVAAGADGLRIILSGGEVIWPWREIRRVDGAKGQARLTRRDSDARLVLADADWSALKPGKSADGRTTVGREVKVGAIMAAVAAALFAGVYFGLPAASGAIAAVMPLGMEERMGKSAKQQVSFMLKQCEGSRAANANRILTRLADRLAAGSGSPFKIEVSVVEAPFPNAFALPGGSVMITSKLIEEADHPDEVAGVLSHEIAHVAERHVVKGFVRSMTFAAITDLVIGGGTGLAAPIAQTAVSASALRYDRDDEAAADAKGADYLRRANIDPGALARFFDKVVEIEKKAAKAGIEFPELLNTHPNSEKRAKALRALARPGLPPSLNAADWAAVKGACPPAPKRMPRTSSTPSDKGKN